MDEQTGKNGDQDQQQATFTFVPLDPVIHQREGFSCGKPSLDHYLQRQATQDIKRGYSSCFVAATPEGRVAAYYTLCSYSVPIEDLPQEARKGLPSRSPVPSVLLGRMAVDLAFQKQHLGSALMADALQRSVDPNSPASHALVVDALDKDAASFYVYFGFMELPSVANRFFLPLAKFRAMS